MSDEVPPASPADPLPPSGPGPGTTPGFSPGGLPSPAPGGTRGWEVACHLAGFSGYLTGVGWILGPLIVWLLKRSEIPSVDAHGKEAVNFQISLLIYAASLFALGFLTCGGTFFLLVPLGIAQMILMIIGGFKAADGELYRYPLTLRLIH